MPSSYLNTFFSNVEFHMCENSFLVISFFSFFVNSFVILLIAGYTAQDATSTRYTGFLKMLTGGHMDIQTHGRTHPLIEMPPAHLKRNQLGSGTSTF